MKKRAAAFGAFFHAFLYFLFFTKINAILIPEASQEQVRPWPPERLRTGTAAAGLLHFLQSFISPGIFVPAPERLDK